MIRLVPSLMLLAALAGCGPVSPELAARKCEERARAAASPISGTAKVGVGSSGVLSDVDVNISVSSDYIKGRDPHDVYDTCVRDLSGQGPDPAPDPVMAVRPRPSSFVTKRN